MRENDPVRGNDFTIACAWCTRILRPGGPIVSHGICAECLESVLGNLRDQLEAQGLTEANPVAPGDD